MYRRLILLIKGAFVLIVLTFLSFCSQQPVSPTSEPTSVGTISKAATAADYVQGLLPGGAIYRIYMPDEWNGDLVTYAHGYVSVTEEVAIPEDQLVLPDGTSIPQMINNMGYAFAVTSYRANGMVTQDALVDLTQLADKFTELYGRPGHNYLVGASEGGLITTKSIEMEDIYAGGLAVCGPIGDFVAQVNYMGDFRVLFDFYFPGILPGSPIKIPQEVMDHWDTVYLPNIIAAVSANPDRAIELCIVAKAAFDPNDPETIGQTVAGLLWYNVFATNDLAQRVSGNPFDNTDRHYHGSDNDAYLNKNVQRIQGDAQAIANAKAMFDTYGTPGKPLITMHTAGDPIVPFWHERLYRAKVSSNGQISFYHNFPVMRYGHCNFTEDEVLKAFAALVFQVTGENPVRGRQHAGSPVLAAGRNLFRDYSGMGGR